MVSFVSLLWWDANTIIITYHNFISSSNAMQLTTVCLHVERSTSQYPAVTMLPHHSDDVSHKLSPSFCQNGFCGCERGFTEVMTSHGFLDYCTRTPGLDHKKADVKTTAGRLRPEHARNKNHIKDWALQPLGPGTTNTRILSYRVLQCFFQASPRNKHHPSPFLLNFGLLQKINSVSNRSLWLCLRVL